ncbi:autotransporter-associated N-terminal domain-containing protein [Leptotrichia wadei]|uniref:autotransporter-associated N-terminal domain-containing protein n=1 Tax=Leptotrichia wadei TaxID=157687 RepID=UPI0028D90245|nr:autotransporter-associated N-terminal domain-containing protein [Leptotrichia wadei]
MTNNLLNLKKDLKSFAKKCKDFKYTDSALLTFLLNGMLISTGEMFAETVTKSQINNQVSQINTSINQMRTDFKHARAENNKLIRDTNLELTQLMEQGDHVTKSPWSSWQFGINDFYNDWHGTYKGKGDKKASYVFERDKSLVNRSSYPGRIETKYGATTLGLVREPNAAMDVSAGLTPKSVNKIAPKFTVQGAGGGFPNFVTRTVKAPDAPDTPVSPSITVNQAPSITFQAQGFGQGGNSAIHVAGSQGIHLMNYATYTGAAADFNVTNAGSTLTSGSIAYTAPPAGTGITITNPSGTISAGDTMSATMNAVFSHVAPTSVSMTGDYSINSTAGHNILFISVNPYNYYLTSGNKTFSFQGKATLNSNGGSSVVGIEHQLLNGGPNGGDVPTNQVVSIVENRGNIILDNGKNMIGMMLDTEYTNDPQKYKFSKQPQTNNEGEIILTGNSSNSIGFDYGFYLLGSDKSGPNGTVKIGDIEINGNSNYGYRQKDYTNVTDRYGRSTDKYYDEMSTVSSGGKTITVNGNKNVGMAIFQGKSTGDPISNFQNINITVNGSKNVGFLRGASGDPNTNEITLDSVKLGTIKFGGDLTNPNSVDIAVGTDNALIRSEKNKIKLDAAITTGTSDPNPNSPVSPAAAQNSILQAVKAAQVETTANGKIKVTSGYKVYGVTAGFDTGGSGASLTTAGDIDMTARESIGLAVGSTNNTGTNTAANVKLTGKKNTAVYNLGTFNQEGNITVDGEKSNGIFNKGTFNLTGNTLITATNGANGLYNSTGGSFTDPDKLTINVTDTTKKGVGVFSDEDVTLDGIKVNVTGGASAVVADMKKITLNNNSKISYDGEGYALYTLNGGKIDMTGSKLTLSGKAVGFSVDGSTGSYVSGVTFGTGSTVDILSDDVILMGVRNPLSLNLSNFDTTLFGAAGGLTSAMINATTAPNYKLAVIDGLNGGKSFTLDSDPLSSDGSYDKSLAVSTPASQSYKYARNLLIQKSILDVNTDVKAVLNSADANTVKGVASGAPVIGLDISSSSGAASNAETGINVNGKTITADRTDSGNGAIGLYTNFGKININNGTLNVETDTTNTVNDQAVGVYAVNGSEVNNNGGNINVGGKNSIGILGLAYREDSAGTVIGNEFGSANEGKATINNNGNITMDGKEAKGVFIKNNGTSSVADNVANNLSNGVITMSGADSVGMYADKATLNNHGKIDLQAGTNGKIGMYGINGSDITNHSDGQIIVGDSAISAATDVPNIGMYTSESNLMKNYGTIDIKENSYGIYGENIQAFGTSKIKVGKNGVGIFAKGTSGTGTVTLDAGSEITTSASAKDKEAVGVFTAGTNPVNINDNGSKMDLKDWTFGYVIKAPGTLTTNGSSTVTLDNEAVYAYSDNDSSVINNYAPIKATGDRNYGIYSSGTVDNYGNMDLKSGNGVGNIGIYSTKGVATNWATIDTGKTNKTTKSYGIGMATGYYDGAVSRNQGTVINKGTINVTEDNSIGMYAVGAGSKAINDHGATINLSGKNTIGMYIDQGAEGENYGTIVGNGDSIKGVVAANQGKFKNYGTIQITGNRGIGIYTDKGVVSADGVDGTGASNTGSFKAVYESSPTDEKVEGGVTIKVPPKATPVTVTINGKAVEITGVDTNATPSSVNATEATVTSPSGVTVLDLAKSGFLNFESNPSATSIGMYVDTSGIKYTNPIQGLSNLAGLTDINMYFGTEAARYTNARAIELGDNIIKPYNDALATVVSTGTVLNTNSSSLTWLAIPTKSSVTGLYDKVYLVKVPYTDFVSAKDPNTYNFLDGLEQRYGVEGLGTREKELFNKLNDLGKGEQHIFTQAVDEMKGHQYANIQQRTNATGNALDKEFSYLRNEWRNPTKQNNKIKAFGLRDEYNTDTAGIIDYKSNAYGVAYVHEDEKVRMGNSSGWYAGAVTNRFRFKDLGKSKEDQTMVKLGVFKTMSPKGDHNGALQWTIGGDVFAGINNMKRKFWVVDDTFEAKSTYHTYGAALKNELGYDIRMSERTHLRPYGALKMEYGRFNDVKEDSGQMRLEVKGNDYFSVKPEAGLEFKYVQPLAVRTNLTVGLTAAYENELGKLQNGNQARVRYTTAGWYNLEKEKEDRRGNGKFDLNIGVDNTRFGVTVNAGYDTKGSNIRGGIGFRAIY